MNPMNTCNLTLEAIAGLVPTDEDRQQGAMLSALSLLEAAQPDIARLELLHVLHTNSTEGPLPEAMIQAVNWIDLKCDSRAHETLKNALNIK